MKTDYLKDLKNSFGLLERTVYYDKSLKILKDQIIGFDENKLKELDKTLFDYLNNGLDDAFDEYLNKIDYMVYPKKIKYENLDYNTNVNTKIKLDINDLQFFIKMPVELHIIGAFWIKEIGTILDNKLQDFCIFGNRVDPEIVKNYRNKKLFYPYYQKFESWQQSAYNEAKRLLDSNNDCVIYTFDISRFFYSIDFNESILTSINENTNKKEYYRLTYLIKKICERYTKKIKYFLKIENEAMLPIGFFPSAIIANWALKKFDEQISKDYSPNYYGRYVDDIIIVKKLYEFEKNDFMDDHLFDFINKKFFEKNGIKEINKYKINKKLVFGSNLFINNDKITISFFDHKYRYDSIDEIIKHLSKNKVVFNYLNDEEIDFNLNPFDIFAHDEKITKFNQLCNLTIDRYKFSVMTAKYKMYISKLGIEEQKNNLKELLKLLSPNVLFDNYMSLEKLFFIYLYSYKIDKKLIYEFIKKISDLEISIECNRIELKDKLNDSYLDYAKVSLATALVNFCGELDPLFFELKKNINFYDIDEKRNEYAKYGCFDKSIMPVYIPFINGAVDSYFTYTSDNFECLSNFDTICNIVSKIKNNKEFNIKIYLREYEKKLAKLLESIILYKEIEKSKDIEYIRKNRNNKKLDTVKIAVSNIQDFFDIKDFFEGSLNRTIKKFINISKIINEAISENSNFIVFPEACIPFEWLSYFINICMKNDVALITGVEPIVFQKNYFNYVISCLPYEINLYKDVELVPHLKKFYSPHEINYCSDNGIKEINGLSSHIINYCNFYFGIICCYEYAEICERALFQDRVDAMFIVEYNKDTNYFDNITSSYARDLHCYVIQVNNSVYGDSRITQPTKTERMNILQVKGGKNPAVLIDTIDVKSLRKFQKKTILTQCGEIINNDKSFKVMHGNRNLELISSRINNKKIC